MLNVVSQLSQGRDVLHGMLSYDVQGHFVCKMFMALITFIITVRDGEAHVVLDGISIQSKTVTVYCDLNLLSLVTVHTVQNQQNPITDSVRSQQLLNPV